MARSGFWDDSERARKLIEELKEAREVSQPWADFGRRLQELEELLELGGGESGWEGELQEELLNVEKDFSRLEFKVMLSGPEAEKNAIFSIQAGAGGTESCDWVQMLWRMYSRWCEEHDYRIKLFHLNPGEEAGIKSLSALISGKHAYGYLRAENGVHRLVRISPFDSGRRRHTSFAAVEVVPELDEEIEVGIDDKDLKIDTYRSSGAGGQHVNVTDSAVRITHLPTGIVVQCQNERSQHKNRAEAMKILKARLYRLEMEKIRSQRQTQHQQQKEIAWGSQIRSYVFHPYTMVKDHRTGLTVGNVQGVMDGDIDAFILEYLKSAQTDRA